MILSCGIDIVEISRIRRSMENPRFLSRVFGEREFAMLKARGFPAQSVAAGFCAKEAFSKALGTGIRGFGLSEAELLRDCMGAPYFAFSGRALALVEERGLTLAVSVSHAEAYTVAQVIAYSM